MGIVYYGLLKALMLDSSCQFGWHRLAPGVSRACRSSLRFLVLTVALVAYGSMPSTAVAQSEVEAQLQEEAAGAATCQFDLRNKLRGASLRRAGVAAVALSGCHLRRAQAASTTLPLDEVRLSMGLSAPLRC